MINKGKNKAMFDEIKAFFTYAPPWLAGALMAVMMSVLRIIYDREETSSIRIVLESLICGALSVCAGSAMDAMGYGQEWYLFCGGVIGFMGSQSIRAFANKFITKKIGVSPPKNAKKTD